MPRRKEHINAGMFYGAGFAAISAKNQNSDYPLLETLGGLAGGYFGGQLPDIIEPATSPRHRDTAHSVAAGIGIIKMGHDKLVEWQQACRRKANEAQNLKKVQVSGSLEELGYILLEMFWLALAGAIAGLLAGYISHLMLDFGTPYKICLI